jgi:16S rRNA (cytidine1402-2'-O)-methyltransferase
MTLYIVATPIGCLDDWSPRARSLLQQVDWVAAEDTRQFARLTSHFQLSIKKTVSLHEHNEQQQVPVLIESLQGGGTGALVSDAGTPLVSDPGYRLVDAAHAANIKVVAVPGPSAMIAALSIAGLPSDRFVFEGFLPAKSSRRKENLKQVVDETRTLVFFESTHRICDCIRDMIDVFGPERVAALAKEMTKVHETCYRETLQSILDWLEQDSARQKGEFVIIVHGKAKVSADPTEGPVIDEQTTQTLKILLAELPLKQAVDLAAKITSTSKNPLYQFALSLKNQSN